MDEFEQWIKERQRQTAGIHAGRTYAAVLRMYRSLGKREVPLGNEKMRFFVQKRGEPAILLALVFTDKKRVYERKRFITKNELGAMDVGDYLEIAIPEF
jgi:hypothetical protein